MLFNNINSTIELKNSYIFMKKLFLIPIVIIVALVIYYFYPSTPLPKGVDIDQIVVHKSERKLMVYSKGNLIKTYKIALGFHPTGAKEIEKDGKTPEGYKMFFKFVSYNNTIKYFIKYF